MASNSNALFADSNRSKAFYKPTPVTLTKSGKSSERGGFLTTLASLLTSGPPKSGQNNVVKHRRLINSWDDVTFNNLNVVVFNFMYNDAEYLTLFSEVERLTGKRREHILLTMIVFLTALVFLTDPIGSITGLMTLLVPGFLTVLSIANQDLIGQEGVMKYWITYVTFVTIENLFSTLIRWDLRLARLIFLSLCLSTRFPLLQLSSSRVLSCFEWLRHKYEQHNYVEDFSTSKPVSAN